MKFLAAALLALLLAPPVNAASWSDVKTMIQLVEGTGTKVVEMDCNKDLDRPDVAGLYLLDKQQNIDHLVFCTNTIDTSDVDAVWEVLSHEGTHVMQACIGGPIINDSYLPRVLRNMQTLAPHYYTIVTQSYNSDSQRLELEAFDMELQEPQLVMDTFNQICYRQ